jgi:multidrug efflux pump subunit AcrB
MLERIQLAWEARERGARASIREFNSLGKHGRHRAALLTGDGFHRFAIAKGRGQEARNDKRRELILSALRVNCWGGRSAPDGQAPGRPPHFGYPIDLAVRGPELERVREFAKELAEQLSKDKKLTDVWANPDSTPRLQRTVDIDRTAAATRGVSLDDILATLRVQGNLPAG